MAPVRKVLSRMALNKVRFVTSNGATFTYWLPWIADDPNTVVWKFLDEDRFNAPEVTNKKSSLTDKGKVEQFQKRYGYGDS